MTIKIILIQTIPILIDGHKMRQSYRDNLAQVMSQRYGKSTDFWRKIDQMIVSDWASYHADLNFSGDDGIADMREGLFRVTRALFTIGKMPEPPKPEITALANDLITMPCRNILQPDILSIIQQLHDKGDHIGTFSYLLEKQLRAITTDSPNLHHIIGADTLNHYEHDRNFFAKLSVHVKALPENITVVTTSQSTHHAITQSGMKSIFMQQSSASLHEAISKIL